MENLFTQILLVAIFVVVIWVLTVSKNVKLNHSKKASQRRIIFFLVGLPFFFIFAKYLYSLQVFGLIFLFLLPALLCAGIILFKKEPWRNIRVLIPFYAVLVICWYFIGSSTSMIFFWTTPFLMLGVIWLSIIQVLFQSDYFEY